MHTFYQIFIPVMTGALVGGLTNLLAIKMLFHPFQSIYIGKWKLPFTPGLIPRRRKDIGVKLGQLVMRHLVTAKGIKNKLTDTGFVKLLSRRAVEKVSFFLDSKRTVQDVLDGLHLKTGQALHLEDAVNQLSRTLIQAFLDANRDKKLHTLLPEQTFQMLERRLPDLSDLIVDALLHNLETEKGRTLIEESITSFIHSRGFFGELSLKLIGGSHLTERLYPVVLQFAGSSEVRHKVLKFLREKAAGLREQTPADILDRLGVDAGTVSDGVAKVVRRVLTGHSMMNQPVQQITSPVRSQILDLVPTMLAGFLSVAAAHIGSILEAFQLEDMVSDQVNRLSLSELEHMIFSLMKKELNMIVNLGYLLGGLIGVIQGVLMILLS
ncbi:DUF445 family protein [Sporolactobacillus sp. Y61]|uniref:DUF445 family protein n=1 Tax=Sporolactobacillus sp. Y61 TaxID=3160863 RepID=A0AAU8IF33_9BACL|nr:DUF445 family protein [Sporolactobacillus sp. THM19-2]RYL94496.1 DUF445 family protein [Sporolactobacillus sp. THM19-2]